MILTAVFMPLITGLVGVGMWLMLIITGRTSNKRVVLVVLVTPLVQCGLTMFLGFYAWLLGWEAMYFYRIDVILSAISILLLATVVPWLVEAGKVAPHSRGGSDSEVRRSPAHAAASITERAGAASGAASVASVGELESEWVAVVLRLRRESPS